MKIVHCDKELRHKVEQGFSGLNFLPIVLDEVSEIAPPKEIENEVAGVTAVEDEVQIAHERVIKRRENPAVYESRECDGQRSFKI